MRCEITQSLLRSRLRGSFLLLLLVTVIALDDRSVWASCGDYLAGHGMQGHNSARVLPDAPPLMASQFPRLPHRFPVCSGPRCHLKQQPAPVAPHRHVDAPPSHDAIFVIVSKLSDGSMMSNWFTSSDFVDVGGPVDRLFRPPRV